MLAMGLELKIVAIVGGYFLGAIPFGVLIMKAAGAGDPRAIGSGNIGATNVLRSGRRDLAALTLIGDGGKGALAVFLAWTLTKDQPQDTRTLLCAIAGGAAFLGHLFPVWLGFKGGKGVATFYGTLIAISWPVGLAAGATWLIIAHILRISSLAALVSAAIAPFMSLLIFDQPYPITALALFMAVLIFIRHQENIRRLLRDEEPMIGQKKSTETPAS